MCFRELLWSKTSDWRGRRVVSALFHAREAALVAAKNARVAAGDGETLFERRPRKVVVVIVLRDVHGYDGFGPAARDSVMRVASSSVACGFERWPSSEAIRFLIM